MCIRDRQNTHSKTLLKFLENPLLRLAILFIVVSTLYFFGVKVNFLTNPFDGILFLEDFVVNIGGVTISPVSWIFTTVWIVWILNLLSWSNGVDGQYGGIIGIGLFIIALLALRFSDLTPQYMGYARLAIIGSGISLGLLGVTWHPSKIMWGFGAMSAGIVLASLSILVQAKIIASILILLIPFLDAVVIFFRRLFSGKPPWKGDKQHLHHLLMNKGFSVQRIAFFYWVVTALFGGLSLLSVNAPLIQTILMIAGVVFFAIIIVSLKLFPKKKELPQIE